MIHSYRQTTSMLGRAYSESHSSSQTWRSDIELFHDNWYQHVIKVLSLFLLSNVSSYFDTGIPSTMMFPSCGPDPPTKTMSGPEHCSVNNNKSFQNIWLAFSPCWFWQLVTGRPSHRERPNQILTLTESWTRNEDEEGEFDQTLHFSIKATNVKVWTRLRTKLLSSSGLLSIIVLNHSLFKAAKESHIMLPHVTKYFDTVHSICWGSTKTAQIIPRISPPFFCYQGLRTFWLLLL